MWTYEKAERLITLWVKLLTNDHAALIQEATLDKPYGWVFFYQSKAWLESRDSLDLLIGPGPVIFDRFNGEIVVKGSAIPYEESIAEYEATLPPARLLATPEGR